VSSASFDEAIRAYYDRRPVVRTATHQSNIAAGVAGDVGIGRGGGAAMPAARTTHEEINDRIRAAARQATNRIDLDGVALKDVL
jgi:hypothetical protein